MKKNNVKKLLRRLPKNTEVVVKDKDGALHSSWDIEIKYTSDGIWVVMFDLSKK